MIDTAIVVTSIIGSVGSGVWVLSSRLSSIEQRLSVVETTVQRELSRNGGESVRDRVQRIEYQLLAHRLNMPDDDWDLDARR